MITLEVSGVREITQELGKAVINIHDKVVLYERMTDFLWEMEGKIFDAHGSHEGHSAWKELTEKWKAYKISHGYSPNPLEFSGALRESLTSFTGYSVLRYLDNGMVFGTDRPYSELHHKGLGKFPEREFLFITGADDNRIKEIMDNWVSKDVLGGYLTSRYARSSVDQFLSQLRRSYGGKKLSGYMRGGLQ